MHSISFGNNLCYQVQEPYLWSWLLTQEYYQSNNRHSLLLIFPKEFLTAAMKAEIETWREVIGPLQRESQSGLFDLGGIFPLDADYGWTRTDMGELWIPRRGVTLHLTPDNYPLYERVIRTYEGNDLTMRDGKIFINGKEQEYYTFKMDYYWMMGDNRDRSADSRYWGFVPEDHIVGSPLFIIASFDQERGLFNGKIRWNRIFANPNPDGKNMRDK